MRIAVVCAAVLTAAALTLLVPAAPGYDAWAWLLWGREIASGAGLDTVDGPAWKPLPVAITTLLAPAGAAAPDLWLLVARAGAIAALVLAFVIGRRLATLKGSDPSSLRVATLKGSDPSRVRVGLLAGGVAAAGVLLTGGFVRHAAVGDSEPLLVALALGAFERSLAGRHRQALALGVLAALLRPEAWPFLAAFALWRFREDRGVRPVLVVLAVAVPAAWVVPELLGSGDPFRAGARARVPNPGQPATADVPALATLEGALTVLVVPLALAAVAVHSRLAAVPALAGAA